MTLRALAVCVCALVLLPGAAAAQPRKAQPSKPTAAAPSKKPQRAVSPEARLSAALDDARRYRGTLRFFENRPQLLRSPKHRKHVRGAIDSAERKLAVVERKIVKLRRLVSARETRRLSSLPPKKAICAVFGRYCGQALKIAWCESRFDTTAENGQYLGLFQMGSSERRLFGHGRTAHAQATAAHKYFVLSGRDWSPWGCRWAAY